MVREPVCAGTNSIHVTGLGIGRHLRATRALPTGQRTGESRPSAVVTLLAGPGAAERSDRCWQRLGAQERRRRGSRWAPLLST